MFATQEFLFSNYVAFQQGTAVFPEQPGVYRLISADREILYVGKAKNLRKRLHSYTKFAMLPLRLKRLVHLLVRVIVTITQTETEALLLEASLIREYKPRFNVLLKDDKSFPSLLLSTHPFPRLTKYRGHPPQEGTSFGPFLATASVDMMVEEIAKVFKIRTCKDVFFANRRRPCLRFDIQRCSGPCAGKIPAEAYQEQVQAIMEILNGKSHALQHRLEEKMQQAASAQRYEEAANYRDQIQAISKILTHQDIYHAGLGDSDLIVLEQNTSTVGLFLTFYRQNCFKGERVYFLDSKESAPSSEDLLPLLVNLYKGTPPPKHILLRGWSSSLAKALAAALSALAGEVVQVLVPQRGKKAQILQQAQERARKVLEEKVHDARFAPALFVQLAHTFALTSVPESIEVYDNSHHRGQFPYGVKIVATSQGFQPKRYRRFPLSPSSASTQDDCALLHETLVRRLRQKDKDPLPDLFLIDGGKGQLSVAKQVLVSLPESPEVIAIAKGPERNAGKEQFFWGERRTLEGTRIPPDLLFFLERLRDEAHRFAITTHRRVHTRSLQSSHLEAIPGIGRRRKQVLLRHFGSIKGVQAASLEDLVRLPGLSKQQAQKILDFVRR
ncbi:MAG: excinuclease ABC subunit UvrC [Holosporales bacterium]|jgi:excinuclease ABC subunit C|nr:excinuclease ABC subunit UvrC [Holosporales bacterium]